MGARVAEFACLFAGVFAASFLLSRANQPPLLLPPSSCAISRLILQPPDESIPVPVANIRTRQIGDTWHALRSEHRRHEGQDIFAPEGTPVYSVTCGILVRFSATPKGGNSISVLGAGGRVYYYAHLSHFAAGLRVQDAVTPQTLLGYVGTTGNAAGTPAHLHFGVYDFTGAINPLPLMKNPPPGPD